MAFSWTAPVDIEQVGIILHKTVNELRNCAVSIVESTIDCVKNITGWIEKLTSPQIDHESRELLEKLGEDLEKLKSDASNVLQSCKYLAEVASDEYQIGRIKKEMEKRGPFRRVIVYVRNKFSRRQTNSELKAFLSSVHDCILTCTDAVNKFYHHYDILLNNIERVIEAKHGKLSKLKKNVEQKRIANAVTTKVTAGAWTSGVACWVVGAAATVLTGGAAAPVVGLAASGFMVSWFTCAGGAIASSITESALNISLSEYNYLNDVLQGILDMQKEMNVIKRSIKTMEASINKAKNVLNGELDQYAELSSYQDDDRENIEESLDQLHAYMKKLIGIIKSCNWQP